MFEKEVMISSLKRNSETLSDLVEELERKSQFSDHDVLYYHEALKRLESNLRRIRKADEELQLVTRAW